VSKPLTVLTVAIGVILATAGGASAQANEHGDWASCEHGLSVELTHWPKGYAVTITDNGLPMVSVTNKGGVDLVHSERAKSAYPITDRTIHHVFVIDVKASDPVRSFTDTVEFAGCRPSWPGYAYTPAP